MRVCEILFFAKISALSFVVCGFHRSLLMCFLSFNFQCSALIAESVFWWVTREKESRAPDMGVLFESDTALEHVVQLWKRCLRFSVYSFHIDFFFCHQGIVNKMNFS